MVRALLESRKTQTRRVPTTMWANLAMHHGMGTSCRLWVRETFCVVEDGKFDGERWVDYRATPRYAASHPAGWENEPDSPDALKWKPCIHMPRWASRLTLNVTDVRRQRLQDLSKDDAIGEGVTERKHCQGFG